MQDSVMNFDLEEEPFDKTKDYYAFLISRKNGKT